MKTIIWLALSGMLLTALIFFLKSIVEQKVRNKIENLQMSSYSLHCKSVSFTGLDHLRINEIVLISKTDTVCTVNDVTCGIDLLLLLKKKVKLNRPIINNVYIKIKNQDFQTTAAVAKPAETPSAKRSETKSPNPQKQMSMKKYSKSIIAIQEVNKVADKTMRSEEKQVTSKMPLFNSMNYFPLMLQTMRLFLEELPEQIDFTNLSLLYSSGNVRLEFTTEKIVVFP